jgi:hypothetical protein
LYFGNKGVQNEIIERVKQSHKSKFRLLRLPVHYTQTGRLTSRNDNFLNLQFTIYALYGIVIPVCTLTSILSHQGRGNNIGKYIPYSDFPSTGGGNRRE